VWNLLTRLKVAAAFIVILLLLAALGSCFPQIPASFADDAQQVARWEAGVSARYGALTDVLAALGTFRWFHSPVFLASLVLLSVGTLVCTLDRWGTTWRQATRPPAVAGETAFDAAPHKATLLGPRRTDLSRKLGKLLEDRGFRVSSQAAGDFTYLRGDRNRLAALATLVTHVGVLLLLVGTILSSGFGWREGLTVKPGGTARLRNSSQLAVRNEAFDITRYPDGRAAAYQARVTILEGGRTVMRGTVAVNQPLRYGDVGFYLRGYGDQEEGHSLMLLAVRDPGYVVVIASGFLLLVSLTVSVNFPRSWIRARIEAGGTLHLVGWAERRACDFGLEFMSVVDEIADCKRVGLEDA
jgi:cytochrome c biogenesis protein